MKLVAVPAEFYRPYSINHHLVEAWLTDHAPGGWGWVWRGVFHDGLRFNDPAVAAHFMLFWHLND